MGEDVEVQRDKLALVVIYQGITEVMLSLAEKQTTRDVSKTLKMIYMGVDTVKTENVQTLMAEIEVLNIKLTELIVEFAMNVNNVPSNI